MAENNEVSQIEERLEKCFRSLFPLASKDEIRRLERGVYPWDSFRHIDLINAIEDEFQIQLPVEDVIRSKNFPVLAQILSSKL